MNKYDLAHQFANVIKQMLIYIQNKTGTKDKLKFGLKQLKVRMFRVRYVPPRYCSFPTVMTSPHNHACIMHVIRRSKQKVVFSRSK